MDEKLSPKTRRDVSRPISGAGTSASGNTSAPRAPPRPSLRLKAIGIKGISRAQKIFRGQKCHFN